MNKKALMVIAVVLIAFMGCKDPDNASKWAGTYITSAGGLQPNTFYRLIITEKNKNTIKIEADSTGPASQAPYFTYMVLQNVAMQSASSATFSETGSVLGYSHPFQLSGTATLNGNAITFQGTGTATNDTIHFYYYGVRI